MFPTFSYQSYQQDSRDHLQVKTRTQIEIILKTFLAFSYRLHCILTDRFFFGISDL